MIVLAALALLLLLALTATQLKLRALGEAFGAVKVRADAQRAQFERDTQSLKHECETVSGSARALAARWQALQRAATALAGASGDEVWVRVTELFAAAGHFRAISVRVCDPQLHSFRVRHALGVSAEALARLRETRVPETVPREWADARNALGPGFVLRARPSMEGPPPAAGSPLAAQDAWFIPFEDQAGAMIAYVSLAQPEPCRLPLAEELPLMEAAVDLVQVLLARRRTQSGEDRETSNQLREDQMRASSRDLVCEGLGRLSDRIRTGLGHVEGYAQGLADFGGDMPREEGRRLATEILSQSQDMCEDALMVRDLAELMGGAREPAGGRVEFAELYAESLQFLNHRAENMGVTLIGPPLLGGISLNHPPGLLRRLLITVSNELLAACPRGAEISVNAWMDQDHVNIHWRTSGNDPSPPGDRESGTPGWIVAQAMAQALGGVLLENQPGPDSRAVSLTIPSGRWEAPGELQAA
jgi:hypothetical protein